ncbi:MAG: hypothetical protein Q7W13_07710 [Bacteroidia bacterium]|nr:hypothetical protein [Bacteroidia bacterium]
MTGIMEGNHKRQIKSGAEFNHLFPKPVGDEVEIKRDANVSETVAFIPQVVLETLGDTNRIAKLLKGNTLNETCNNIWHFVYDHIQYAKDKDGVEQVRRPARAWHDRTRGVDCDCFTVFISSILTNLNIPHIYRITKYKNRDYFQHIYPIVPTSKSSYITMDCVVNYYNYEEPYSEKKDTPMKLHYLNGIDTDQNLSLMTTEENIDTLDLMGTDDFDGIGKINLKKIKEGAKKVLHVVNRVNPATGLLRVGILASMKLNLMKIAGRIRYAYLTDAQAQAKGLDMQKLQKLRSILKKLEDVFYSGGGKKENLKKAILTGKGNKDHEVSGLGMIADSAFYDENTPLDILLSGIYEDEVMEGLNGLGVVTATAVAAASSALAIIAGLIKQIGGMKKDGKDVPAGEEGSSSESVDVDEEGNTGSDSSNQLTKRSSSGSGDNGNSGSSGNFIEKTKNWVKEHPMQTGAIALGVTALGVMAVKHFTKKKEKPKGLSGLPHKKGKKRKGKSNSKHKYHKTTIELL